VFTDVTEGEKYEADIVMRARFRDREAFFLVHVENQSTARGLHFGRRMFLYWSRLFEKYGLPVYPIVVFSYDAPERAEPDSFAVAFPDLDVLTFRYRVVQLNRLNWRDFVTRENPVASALMAKMRIAPEDRWRVKLQCLRLLATLRLDPARMQLISGFVDSYLRLSAREESEFQTAFRREVPAGEQEAVMQIVTSWMEQGIEKGIEQGIQQGIERGMERTILRVLGRRFGPLSEAREARIVALGVAQLDALADALLDFAAVEELDAWLDEHPATDTTGNENAG
jgi:Putative transposase, YhgA-like.